MKTKNRRKWLPSSASRLLATLVVLAVSLAACGGGVDDGEAPTAAGTETQAADAQGDTEDDGTSGSANLQDSPITIPVSHVNTEDHPVHTATLAVADAVAERTNGEVTLDVFANAALGSTTETTEQAALGENMISYLDAGHAATFGVPELGMLASPFLLENYDQAHNILESDLMAEWTDQLAETGNLRVLSLNWFSGARHIVGAAPYPTPDDLRGTTIRIPPAPTWEVLFGDKLGATPVTVEFAELYSGMQQGVVDAAEVDITNIYNADLHEVADYITLTGHFEVFLGYVISDNVFQDLPSEYQEILLEEFWRGGEMLTEMVQDGEAGLRQTMEDEFGIEFVEIDRPAYEAAIEGFFDEFPEWPQETAERLYEARQ